MNAPDAFDPNAFDNRIQSAYDDATDPTPTPPPPLRAWAGLQPHLLPPRAVFVARRPLVAGIGGLLLGLLLMWGIERPDGPNSLQPDPAQKAAPATSPAVSATSPAVSATSPITSATSPTTGATSPATGATSPTTGATSVLVPVVAASALSGAGTTTAPALGPAVLQPLIQLETSLAGLANDTTPVGREVRRAALLTQRAELATLTRRADSLLRALDGAAVALGPQPPAADSSSLAPPRRRWSVAVAFAPERNFFGLGAPAADTLSALRRTHEQGRGGYNASAMAEYRLDSRLSVGAGLGVASYGAELRLTESRTLVSTHFDSATTISATVTTVTTRAYAIRPVPDSILAPILNVNQQVIGFQ